MRIFFQNPTKGPLITVSFDAGDGASLAFVPAVVDCGAKYGVVAAGSAAGAPVIAAVVTIGALVSGDSPVRVPVPVVPNPIEGINRFAPRANAVIDAATANPAPAVDLPEDSSPTTATEVSPADHLAAALKDWDGVAPLEIAGFKFVKVADADGKSTIKITISTDNVQDIIDAARAIQEVLPKDTHTLAVEVNAPALRWNLIMWAHNYFKEGFTQIKAEQDHILALSQKLERGGTLSEEDQVFLKGLKDILTELYGRRADFNRDFALIRFLVLKSSPNSGIGKIWGTFTHDFVGLQFPLLGFEAVLSVLKKGHSLKSHEIIILLNTNPNFQYIIRKSADLVPESPFSGDVEFELGEGVTSLTLANDDHFQVLVEILTNLTSNAARYSNPKKEKREIHITVRRTDNGLEIEVRDNGIGIPANKLQDIGQFGFRVGEKRVDGSHGHGLWQTNQNLRDLGWGKLHVESTHGEGSRFGFTIPGHDVR